MTRIVFWSVLRMSARKVWAGRSEARNLLKISRRKLTMRTAKTIAAAAFALLLVATCSSYYPGGNNGPVYGNNGSYDIRGTVDSVDTGNHSIWLVNASGYNTGLASSSGNAVRVYYGNNTT